MPHSFLDSQSSSSTSASAASLSLSLSLSHDALRQDLVAQLNSLSSAAAGGAQEEEESLRFDEFFHRYGTHLVSQITFEDKKSPPVAAAAAAVEGGEGEQEQEQEQEEEVRRIVSGQVEPLSFYASADQSPIVAQHIARYLAAPSPLYAFLVPKGTVAPLFALKVSPSAQVPVSFVRAIDPELVNGLVTVLRADQPQHDGDNGDGNDGDGEPDAKRRKKTAEGRFSQASHEELVAEAAALLPTPLARVMMTFLKGLEGSLSTAFKLEYGPHHLAGEESGVGLAKAGEEEAAGVFCLDQTRQDLRVAQLSTSRFWALGNSKDVAAGPLRLTRNSAKAGNIKFFNFRGFSSSSSFFNLCQEAFPLGDSHFVLLLLLLLLFLFLSGVGVVVSQNDIVSLQKNSVPKTEGKPDVGDDEETEPEVDYTSFIEDSIPAGTP